MLEDDHRPVASQRLHRSLKDLELGSLDIDLDDRRAVIGRQDLIEDLETDLDLLDRGLVAPRQRPELETAPPVGLAVEVGELGLSRFVVESGLVDLHIRILRAEQLAQMR